MVTNGNMINIVCIGTPRHNNDMVGPLVGTLLKIQCIDKKYPVNIIGTMDDPVHGLNIEDKITKLPPARLTIGVDSAVGTALGDIIKRDGPIKPGSGMGKMLPPVGDISFVAITCENERNFINEVLSTPQVHELAHATVKHIEEYLSIECKRGILTWAKQQIGNLLDAIV